MYNDTQHDGSSGSPSRRMLGAPLFMPAFAFARTVRRAALIYTGIVSLCVESGGAAFTRAHGRGREMELALLDVIHRVEELALECDRCFVLRRRPAAAAPPAALRETYETREEQLKAALDRLGVPSLQRVQAISAQLAALEAEIDARLAHLSSPPPSALPLAGYETLTISEIAGRLDELDIEQLNALRAYETANGRRRTLLNQLDRRIARAAP